MKKISRRDAGGLFLAIGGLASLAFAGCGGSETNGAVASDTGSDPTDSGGTEAATDAASEGGTGGWARGGTAAMTDKASYPDPFATASTACMLLAAATEGPCTEAADRERVDISEGFGGLPVRLSLRFVDSACNAVAGAKVKIWHTQLTGSYSGDTPNNGMCLKDAADSAKHYFRGVQTTDASGHVAFDTCFPGWYRGRCIHIHFTVTTTKGAFTSQLVFDQALITEIFSSHPDYESFGQPDTPNASDMVVMGDVAAHQVETARMSDGAMLAWKQIAVNI